MKKLSLELFFRKREHQKDQKQVNYKQVETKDDDEKADVSGGKVFHKAGAESQKDLFVIFRREELEGRFRLTREEKRIERLGVNERRERR